MTLVKHNYFFEQSKITIFGTISIGLSDKSDTKSNEQPWFFGSQVAKLLEYQRPRDAIRNHVRDKHKRTVEEYILEKSPTQGGGVKTTLPLEYLKKLQRNTVLINEYGLYDLIFSSKLEKALIFQDWVTEEVLPSIRKNGGYGKPIHNQFMIMTENDLHRRVVRYLKKYHPNIFFTATLGENQDTSEKRIESKELGYKKGIQDIIIYELNKKYNGLAIEFKTPNGKGIISMDQIKCDKKMKERNIKTMIIDDYDECIHQINEYLSTRRIVCPLCNGRFKNDNTLDNHQKWLHRIC